MLEKEFEEGVFLRAEQKTVDYFHPEGQGWIVNGNGKQNNKRVNEVVAGGLDLGEFRVKVGMGDRRRKECLRRNFKIF